MHTCVPSVLVHAKVPRVAFVWAQENGDSTDDKVHAYDAPDH